MHQRPKHHSVNGHEITLNVHFQHIRLSGVVARYRPDMVLKSLNPKKSAFTFSARIGVIYELTVEQRSHIVIIQVMHHPIPEIRSEMRFCSISDGLLVLLFFTLPCAMPDMQHTALRMNTLLPIISVES